MNKRNLIRATTLSVMVVCVVLCLVIGVEALGAAVLELTKTACSPPPCSGGSSLTVDEGDDVLYCYELTNTGDAAVLNVIIIDDNGTPGLTGDDFSVWPDSNLTDEDGDTYADDLAPGATATGSAMVTLSVPGSVTNIATAHGTDATSGGDVQDSDTFTVTVNDREAVLELTKTACSPPPCSGGTSLSVDEGDDVLYCYELTNTGDAAALNVIIIDNNGTPGSTGDDFSVWPDSNLTDEDGDTYADDLAPGATTTGSAMVTLSVPGLVTNIATAHGTDATSGEDVQDSDTFTVTVNNREAVLELTKTVCSSLPCPGSASLNVDEGDSVFYCFEVENTGSAAAINVAIVDDNATPGSTGDDFLVPLTGLTDEDGDLQNDDLAPGGVASGSVQVTLVIPGDVTNTATAHGYDATSGGEVTDSDSVTVAVSDRVAELQITKTVTTLTGSCPGSTSLTVDEGDTVKYCYEIENTGDAATLNLVVLDNNGTTTNGTDDFSVTLAGLTDEDGDTFVDDLGPGGTATGSALVLLTSPGTVINTATAFGQDATSGGNVNHSDTATVTVNDLYAQLRLTKTVFQVPGTCPGTATLTVDEGDTVQFCHKIENGGTAAALDIQLQDVHTIPGSPNVTFTLTGFPGLTDEDHDGEQDDLAAGAFVTVEDAIFNLTYTSPGIASNAATASGFDATSGAPVSASDTATVTINNLLAELRLTKTVFRVPGDCPGVEALTVDEGDMVQFCHKIENVGDGAALDIQLKDVHTIPGAPPVTFILSGFAGLTDEDGDGSSDDLAAGASLTLENPLFALTYNSPGNASNTATVSGFDATSGPLVPASDTATVEVTNVPPTMHDCPGDRIVDNDPGMASAIVTWTPPTATDPSGIPPTLTSTHAPGDTFPLGLTRVTYTATDADGGEASCSFEIIVSNGIPPLIDIDVPQEDESFVLGADVAADWTAISPVGIGAVDATMPSGDRLDTSRIGQYTFFVRATDIAGLTAEKDVSWRVIPKMGPADGSSGLPEDWLCIDRPLPIDERPMIGSVPLGGIYPAGDPICIQFSLCDAAGHLERTCVVSLSLTRVSDPTGGAGPAGDLLEQLLRYHLFTYDPEYRGYHFELQTWGYPPGYYDLWIAVDAVLLQRVRIQIMEPEE